MNSMDVNSINVNLEINEEYIKQVLGDSSDVVFRHFVIPAFNYNRAFLFYIDGLIDAKELDDIILAPLMAYSQYTKEGDFTDAVGVINSIVEAGLLAHSARSTHNWNELLDSALSGETIILVDGCDTAIIVSTRGWEARSISEPATESEVRGPRDGFIESIRTNTALIRRRIRDYSLRFETMKIGERTKTEVTLAYIDNIVDKKILGELKSRLNKIQTDSILESGYIEEFIEDSPRSIFPQIEHTERPDKACAAILEGKILILVDNTPFTLIVPTVFWQYIQATGDYFERHYVATFTRWLRLLALFLSLTISPFYIMLVSYHQEMLPTLLALKIAAGREGVPFPSIGEVLLLDIMFEIMREAGLRMPKPIGQAVSIVGALVIGEAAVNAGLVGPALVIVIAAGAISSFAVPAYNLSVSFRLLRFPLIILTGTFGILGFLGGSIAITLHLLSLRSFGTQFLTPMAPLVAPDNKDVAVRMPWWAMKKRPTTAKPIDKERQAQTKHIKPRPPKEN